MGRKKKVITFESMCNDLFHKDYIEGFQFTAGRTPLDIKENNPLRLSASLNKTRSSVVIDCLESDVEDMITAIIFPDREQNSYSCRSFNVTMKEVKSLQKQFKKLGYEVESAEFAGEWYWFRVKCKYNEIPEHVNKLAATIKL